MSHTTKDQELACSSSWNSLRKWYLWNYASLPIAGKEGKMKEIEELEATGTISVRSVCPHVISVAIIKQTRQLGAQSGIVKGSGEENKRE